MHALKDDLGVKLVGSFEGWGDLGAHLSPGLLTVFGDSKVFCYYFWLYFYHVNDFDSEHDI